MGLRLSLTEAGSREYSVTAVIAALAGAEVCALTRDSSYATVAEVRHQVTIVAHLAGVDVNIKVITDRNSGAQRD